jgi:hypothetical protein
MEMSETISELAKALAKAQGEIEDATKDSVNPAFRSKYADIASIRAVIRGPLSSNGLAVVQNPTTSSNGVIDSVTIETRITHTSGEFITGVLRMPIGKSDPHGVGSGITYARRYALMSMLCLASDDDDGNAAVETPKQSVKVNEALGKKLGEDGDRIANEGIDALRGWYGKLSASEKASLGQERLDRLVEKAKTIELEAGTTN